MIPKAARSILLLLTVTLQLDAQTSQSSGTQSSSDGPSASSDSGSVSEAPKSSEWRASDATGLGAEDSLSSGANATGLGAEDSLSSGANATGLGAEDSLSSGANSSAPASLDAHKVRPAKPAVPMDSSKNETLPNEQGQVWKRYDISIYTEQVEGVEAPQQAIIDWILRETGTDVWFTSPVGLLSADDDTLSVYHTPEMQRIVAEMVGRFVNGTQDPHVLNLKLISVSSPNWRTNYVHRLRPIDVQSPGIDAWLLSKEDAALLLAELRRRSDFREYTTTNVVFHNGQTEKIDQRRPRNYVRSYQSRKQQNVWMGYDIDWRQFQEGFTLQISPLLSQDERTLDTVIKCEIDQLEKLLSVDVNLPGFPGQMQRAEIQVPQVVSWRLHERFRWPTRQVLLLSCGVVASPGPERASTFGFPNPFTSTGRRANALMLVESGGKASQALLRGQATTERPRSGNPAARY
ncbi:MAG: hypothetical protein ACODAD_13390 [Planctomycetota bacterium]